MSDVQRTTELKPANKPSEIAESMRHGASVVEQHLAAEIPRSLSTGEPAIGQGQVSESGQAVMKKIEEVAKDTQRIVEEKIQPALREAELKGNII